MWVTVAPFAGLFAWSFLAATVLPLSSEAPLAALVYARRQVVLPVAVATVGNYLGACTTYWIGRRAGRWAEGHARPSNARDRAVRLTRRYGPPVLLLSWVPLLGDALVAVAGAAGMPFGRFSLWTILGKLARYAAVAWAVSRAFG